MTYYLKEFPDCLRQVYITYSAEEIEDKFNQALAEIQKSFNFSGYRKGKVPFEIIEKQNNENLIRQVVNKTVYEAMGKLRSDNIILYSDPKFHPVSELLKGQGFSFYLVFEVVPYLEEDIDFENIKVDYEEFYVDDKMIEKVATNKLGTLKKVNGKIQEEDTVTLNILNEEFTRENRELTLTSKEVKSLIGKKAGDKVELSFSELGDMIFEVLGHCQEPLNAEVITVERNNEAKLDDETVKEVSPYKTVKEYLESIRAQLNYFADTSNRSSQRVALSRYIGQNAKVSFPKSAFLDHTKREAARQIEQNFYVDHISLKDLLNNEKIKDSITQLPLRSYESISFFVVLDEIATRENLQISDEQINYIASARAKEEEMNLQEYKKKISEADWENIKTEARREIAEKWLFDRVKFNAKTKVPVYDFNS